MFPQNAVAGGAIGNASRPSRKAERPKKNPRKIQEKSKKNPKRIAGQQRNIARAKVFGGLRIMEIAARASF
jgi:hypothetical protein